VAEWSREVAANLTVALQTKLRFLLSQKAWASISVNLVATGTADTVNGMRVTLRHFLLM
jgi:hypothetical protein